ncbi:hypothetical protein HMPREF1143_0245 [Peptoanaerobacter stomatis]|uniref:Uncharacterized protein n=1 Tax=Peptoanaerobacter stomatis TaxID=796937 RepID=J6HFG2_9FIRM|nr:hypothetical protein HMPREF1143_0245 [Peptoanaerobacter stomatis]
MDAASYCYHPYKYGFCSGKRKRSGKTNGAGTGEKRRKSAAISQ